MNLFDVERDAEGRPKIVAPGAAPPTAQQVFRRRCFLNAVTEPEVIERLWAEECARRTAAERGRRGKRRQRSRR